MNMPWESSNILVTAFFGLVALAILVLSSNEAVKRLIRLAEETFDARNDPEQLSMTEEDRARLLALHPATLSQESDETRDHYRQNPEGARLRNARRLVGVPEHFISVHQEMFRLLAVPAACPVLRQMEELGFLNHLLPELAGVATSRAGGVGDVAAVQHLIDRGGQFQVDGACRRFRTSSEDERPAFRKAVEVDSQSDAIIDQVVKFIKE